MVDLEGRKRLGELVRHFASGRMTNDEFEDAYFGLNLDHHRDRALWAVFDAAWCLYSDNRTYRLVGADRLPRPVRRQVARWVLFLHSDHEYEWPINGVSTANEPLWLLPFELLTLGWFSTFWWRRKLSQLRALGDWDCWPFMRKEDYQRALACPFYCTGGAG